MKERIINLVKYNRILYLMYYYSMCFVIRTLGLVTKSDNKLVLFNSFAGRKFDDSPREIYEYMKRDLRFEDYKFIWAFHEPNKYGKDGLQTIKTDTFEYFKTALKAKVWITNSSVERGLKFKKPNTIYINTWHGTPIKKMGSDIVQNQSFKPKGESEFDAMNAQSDFEVNVFSRSFSVPEERFLRFGLPRNDILSRYTREDWSRIRKVLNIPENKCVILYCPTFREYEKDEYSGVVMAPPMDVKKWVNKLGEEYVLLIRSHYEVSNVMNILENGQVRNVTSYPVLNDLMIASDILVSDYSSIFFDYSIMDKPMLHFSYDYDTYDKKRGMYFDIRDYLEGSDNEDELIQIIISQNSQNLIERTKAFRRKYMNYYGDATGKTVDHIAQLLHL